MFNNNINTAQLNDSTQMQKERFIQGLNASKHVVAVRCHIQTNISVS